jgi:hypothetical protein
MESSSVCRLRPGCVGVDIEGKDVRKRSVESKRIFMELSEELVNLVVSLTLLDLPANLGTGLAPELTVSFWSGFSLTFNKLKITFSL